LTNTSKQTKLKANKQTVFAMLHAAGAKGLTLEDWNNQAREAGIGTRRKSSPRGNREGFPQYCPLPPGADQFAATKSETTLIDGRAQLIISKRRHK
jgi:hypothetical protein